MPRSISRTTSCWRCCSPPKRCGATARKRLVLVAPYLCYMRQDAAFHEGEAISQKVVGRLLAGSVDRVITVDAHLHRTKDIADVFPGIEADNLSAMPAIAECAARRRPRSRDTIVVGPDAESRPWVSDLAGRLGLTHAVARKTRRGDRSVEIAFADPALFAGRPVLLVDDIVSSGGTLIACAKALAAAGATAIDAIITHALFPPEMAREFLQRRHPLDPLDQQRAASDQCDRARRHPCADACAAKSTADFRDTHERHRSILRRGPHRDRLVLSVRDAEPAACWSTAACSRGQRR